MFRKRLAARNAAIASHTATTFSTGLIRFLCQHSLYLPLVCFFSRWIWWPCRTPKQSRKFVAAGFRLVEVSGGCSWARECAVRTDSSYESFCAWFKCFGVSYDEAVCWQPFLF